MTTLDDLTVVVMKKYYILDGLLLPNGTLLFFSVDDPTRIWISTVPGTVLVSSDRTEKRHGPTEINFTILLQEDSPPCPSKTKSSKPAAGTG
jgi:hypothetical protein